MEKRAFRIILAIVLIIASLVVATLALILYSRQSVAGLWVVPGTALCLFLLGSVTLVSILRKKKKSLSIKSSIPPEE